MNKKFFFPLSSTAILFFLFFFIDPALANNDFSQLDYSELVPLETVDAYTYTYYELPEDRFLNSVSFKCKIICVGDYSVCRTYQESHTGFYLNIENEPDDTSTLYGQNEGYILDQIMDYSIPVNALILAGTNYFQTENIDTIPGIACQTLGNSSGDQYVLFDWYEEPTSPAVDFPYQNDIHFISGMVEYYSSTTGTTTPFQTAKYYFQIPFLLYAFIFSIVIMIFFPLFVIAKFYK